MGATSWTRRALVAFAPLNLVESLDAGPDPGTVDVLLCRHVLMYLTPEAQRAVAARLAGTLAPDGWLLPSPTEASADLFRPLRAVHLPGAIFFRAPAAHETAPVPGEGLGGRAAEGPAACRAESGEAAWPGRAGAGGAGRAGGGDPGERADADARTADGSPRPARPSACPTADAGGGTAGCPPAEACPAPPTEAQRGAWREPAGGVDDGGAQPADSPPGGAFDAGRPGGGHEAGLPRGDKRDAVVAELARVRALADRGELEAAARACEALLARERLDPAPALLLAAIHQERGDLGAARRALRHALYLAPDSPVAHFVLGSVLRRQGERLRSHRAMRSVIDLLAGWPPEVPVPGAEGLTAGRLREAAEAALASRRAGRGLPIGGRGGGGRGG